LAFRYNASPFIENISFELGPGQILALIGPNGAGKSTLLKCLDGLLKCQKGSIELNGKEIKKMHRKEIAGHMAYVPQTVSNIFPIKVFDIVLQGRYPHGNGRRGKQDIEKAFKALWLMGAQDLAMKNFTEISGGQKQKATIARAIAQEAEVLLLDEPTSNLDIRRRLEVMELLRSLITKNDMSAILSMHDLNLTSRYADKVIMMDQGAIIAAGEPFSVLTAENIASVYRVEVAIMSVQDKPYIVPLKPLSNGTCQKPDDRGY
jgi:iron complex transport system ATP-binding protein